MLFLIGTDGGAIQQLLEERLQKTLDEEKEKKYKTFKVERYEKKNLSLKKSVFSIISLSGHHSLLPVAFYRNISHL